MMKTFSGGHCPPRSPLGVGARPPNPLRKDTLEGGWDYNFILGGFVGLALVGVGVDA